MDRFDLFKELSSGARFNFKKYKEDAEKLGVKINLHMGKTTGLKEPETVAVNEDFSAEKQIENQKLKISGSEASSASECDSSTSSDDEDKEEEENEISILGQMKSVSQGPSIKQVKKHSSEKQKELHQEKINHIRKKLRVHAHGTDIPDPLENFHELANKYSVHQQIIQNIENVGYKYPTPIQAQAIPVMLKRREIMACAPTGSGKTAAFIIPILHHLKEPRKQGIRALVLAPTRELAQQIFRESQRLSEGRGFRIQYIEKVMKAIKTHGSKILQKYDILVSTPNKLVYMLNEDQPVLNLDSVEWLVIDESDKLFEEGKRGFRDQLAQIYKACGSSHLRRAMFSATFAYDVEQWCKQNLDNVVQVYIGGRNTATDTVKQELKFVGSESGKLLEIRNLIRQGICPPVLVFVQSKERAKELFSELIYDGMNVDVIHADRTQTQRDNTVNSFRAGKIWILICTELMGRGIDFKGVNLVINYDFPNSAISYIHRIGRTGRAGRVGQALTFFTEDDISQLRSIANLMREAGCPVPEYMLNIRQISRKKRKKMAQRVPKRESIATNKMFKKKPQHKSKNVNKTHADSDMQKDGPPAKKIKAEERVSGKKTQKY